ncbi:hypothetical protein [Weissella sagaensis]|jgi:uncharacterized membrane protein SpoIIM required for sporulation|uniref:DUF2273 domain-containing protein n=1 Tax=Weissella sagaensis TaxID=2559928 RepID=A0ABW1RTB8_9LACO|nr:hypothetical protein [Weissella sagaensis]MBU7567991.1 hypothetical protein [Weissella hellenica]QDJ58874.1 hypothetical protein EFA59_04750 [Weissella hellenica]QEA57832.1 hypothetical protein FGL75_08070 [Weissella hellenica]UEG66962.1 hypothetical protein GZH44_00055 [Weissella hellenica]
MKHKLNHNNKLIALIMFLGMLITIIGIFLDSFSLFTIMVGLAIILFSEEISKIVNQLFHKQI